MLVNEYVPGSVNVICQRCGFKYKIEQVRKEWTGLLVCTGPRTNDCWEERNPGDLARPYRPAKPLAWTRAEQPDQFIEYDPVFVSISGVSGTGSVGSLTYGIAMSLTGVSGTGSVGNVAPCTIAFNTAVLPATLQWTVADHDGATTWVAAGQAANTENPVAYSTDGGATWLAGTGAYTNVFSTDGLAFNGTTWSCLGADSGTHKAMTSTDGQAWTQRTLTTFLLNTDSSNSYIAIGSTFYGVGNLVQRHLYSSTNGYDFTERSNVLPNAGQAWSALATNGTTAVAVAGATSGNTSVAGKIDVGDLPTGLWTQTAMSASSNWWYVIWTSRIYFAVAAPGIGAKSTDGGATWASLTLPTATDRDGITITKYGVPTATSSGQIILPIETVSDSGMVGICWTSCDDGATWSSRSTGQQGKWAASGSDGTTVVIVGTDTGSGSTKAAYSG